MWPTQQFAPVLEQRYRQELRKQTHEGYGTVLVAAGALFLAFSILDYFFVPHLSREFFIYRATVVILYLLILFLRSRDHDMRLAHLLPAVAYILSLLVINLMVIRMGGVESPYFAGFIVAIVFYTAILPLEVRWVLLLGFSGLGLYVVSMFFCCELDGKAALVLFNNTFFITSFVVLVAVKCFFEDRTRREMFRLHLDEEEMTAWLDGQALRLEREVAERTRRHQQIEQRFRNLFEHIADNVILVTQEGRVLRANPPFFRMLGLDGRRETNIFDLVPVGDHGRFRRRLVQPVAAGETVRGFRQALCGKDGSVIETEINGNILRRGNKQLGLQLVIRDITLRRRMEEELRLSLQAEKQTETATIMALARLSEYRDRTPPRHLERIREYTRLLATELMSRPSSSDELEGADINDLALAAVLHDIGKVGVPDTLLSKKGSLTEEEKDQLRQHTVFGGDVIRAMQRSAEGSGFLEAAKNIAYFHHERWDGNGYPFGLRGYDIPLVARVVALADGYESMTASSLYKKRKTHAQAIHEIIQQTGHHFDPMVVDAFLAREEEFIEVIQRYPPENPDQLRLIRPSFVPVRRKGAAPLSCSPRVGR